MVQVSEGLGARSLNRQARRQATHLSQAQHLSADTDAALVENLDGDLVALANLTHDAVLGDLHVRERYGAGGRSADAELVLLLAHLQAGCVTLSHEAGDALVSLGLVHVGEDLRPGR